jgi:hypothetical protein
MKGNKINGSHKFLSVIVQTKYACVFRRLKEKFDAEVKDLELSEKAIKTKYTETKGKLGEKEDEVISLKANVRHLEKELEEARKVCI